MGCEEVLTRSIENNKRHRSDCRNTHKEGFSNAYACKKFCRSGGSENKDNLVELGKRCSMERFNYFGKELDNGEYVTIEEYIEGKFVKYINNTGEVCDNGTFSEKAQCLAHFSYEKSIHKLMVLDIQGTGHKVYDPEIASLELVDNDEFLFSTGYLSQTAIECFVSCHKCNIYCKSFKVYRI